MPDVVRRADKIVVPGQGAFGVFMRGLAERGLGDALREAIARGRPYLGICLGMQVLFDDSEEQGALRGPRRPRAAASTKLAPRRPRLKVPHIGWNQVVHRRGDPLLAGIADGAYVYFVHSYHAVPADPVDRRARGRARRARSPPAIRKDNLFACQFHPEKSQAVGLPDPAQLRGTARVKLYLPAIDLLGGRAVRLEEGKRERATVFHDRPVELVAELARDGADRLHVVDLDGAFGEPRQLALIAAIVAASPIPVEVGGGIRDRAAIETVLALGAAFVVLGTAAVRSPALVEEACRAHPGRIIVAVDATRRHRRGRRLDHGERRSPRVELGARAAGWGAAALLYTDVAPRRPARRARTSTRRPRSQRAVGCEVIASGGVGTLADLAALRDAGIAGGRRRPRALRRRVHRRGSRAGAACR